MTWTAGWNEPGFLPESEPATFDTWEEARASIEEEIRGAADAAADDEAYEQEYATTIASVQATELDVDQAFDVECDGWVYWVLPTEWGADD